jgi:TPR repeat protein
MPRYPRIRSAVLLLLFGVLAGPALAQMSPMPSTSDEPPSRFNSGNYFLTKGEQEFLRGRHASALERWKISAFWGQKIAQYNLGLMYFRGVGTTADRARGVAWLALASERGDEPFKDALEWGYAQLDAAGIEQANRIWREELKPRYGDTVALPRAMKLWLADTRMSTGSRTGHPIGPLTVGGEQGEEGMNWYREQKEKTRPDARRVYPKVEIGDMRSLEKKP